MLYIIAMTSTHRQIFYGSLAIIGTIATWYFNIQFMNETGGFTMTDFINANYVNAASASISNDIIVAAIAFTFWSFFEARRLQMKHWWVYAVLTNAVAFAFAYPLFLLMRERKISAQND